MVALGKLRQRIAANKIERRPVAEEIGLVVEQSFDHLLRQIRLLAHDQDGDQLVQCTDSALTKQSGERSLDPPPSAHRQLLAGARFEQAGEDSAGAVADLH